MFEAYFWIIEWIPDDPDNPSLEYTMIGTREEAEAESERRHPNYLCREIVFHRQGKAGLRSGSVAKSD